MKSLSIVAIAVFALIALCSSVPVDNQQVEPEARLDFYNDFLANLLQGLVQTTLGTASNFLNQLITENPLGVGKRDAEDDLAARVDALSFIYDNILQQLFSGLVTNTFGTISNTLTNLIQTNPLGVGKRDVEGDLAARVDALSFIYDNILQQLFSGLVTNTFGTISNTLTNLIQTNPLGVGKRALGLSVNPLQFLYDNVVAEFFGDLASNTAGYLQNALNNLLSKPFQNLNLGKRSVNLQQAQTLVTETVSALIQKFKTFARQAVAVWNTDRQKFTELVKDSIDNIKATVAKLADQLSELIPSAITTEVSEVLATLRSVLVYLTSGLAGSLGPVIGAFRP
jgi:uncharacterized membrane protein YdcZ (DUF606 family)/cell fate (sporulation/competence/biofilm development) regulator YmcA (YheA/YmcA/DUF963 family)